MHGRVRAWSRSTAQQTAATAVGLGLGSDDGLDGTIGFDGEQSCAFSGRRDRNATLRPVVAACCLSADRSPEPGRREPTHRTCDPFRAQSPRPQSRSRTTASSPRSSQPRPLDAWRTNSGAQGSADGRAIVPGIEPDDRYPERRPPGGHGRRASRCRRCTRQLREVATIALEVVVGKTSPEVGASIGRRDNRYSRPSK